MARTRAGLAGLTSALERAAAKQAAIDQVHAQAIKDATDRQAAPAPAPTPASEAGRG